MHSKEFTRSHRRSKGLIEHHQEPAGRQVSGIRRGPIELCTISRDHRNAPSVAKSFLDRVELVAAAKAKGILRLAARGYHFPDPPSFLRHVRAHARHGVLRRTDKTQCSAVENSEMTANLIRAGGPMRITVEAAEGV